MPPDHFDSLITRQLKALKRAQRQVASFRKGLFALREDFKPLNANQLAIWLKARRIRCTKRKANWTPKITSDRLYFRLDTDKLRADASMMEFAISCDDPDLARRAARVKGRIDGLNGMASPTVTEAITILADRLDRDAEAVGREIRAGFDL